MREFLYKRWALFVVLGVFTALKLPHLYYAYYWDESVPYAPAISYLSKHGISLLPNAIDPSLSHGHPLLFHALAASWMKIFGNSHLAMHTFALVLSLLLLIALYEAALILFDWKAAVLSIVLVSAQMIFFVQASFVLPEILVALLSFLSLLYFVRRRYFLAALFLSGLFFTKESGLVMGAVLGTYAFIELVSRKTSLHVRLYRLLSVALPFVLIGLFFLLQKQTWGWYIFPMHQDYIETQWNIIWYTFRIGSLKTAFVNDYRYFDFLALLAVSLVAAIKNKNGRYLIFFFPGVVLYYFVDDMRAGRIMPPIPFLLVFIISIAVTIFVLVKMKLLENRQQREFMMLSCAFILCYSFFSAINFFTARYMLAAVVQLLFFLAFAFSALIKRTYQWLLYPILCIVLVVSGFNFATDTSLGDCNIGAFDALDVQQHAISFLEQNHYYDSNISCGNLNCVHLSDVGTGFLSSEKNFKRVSTEITDTTDILMVDNIEINSNYSEKRKDPAFHLIHKYQKGIAWVEIYRRIHR